MCLQYHGIMVFCSDTDAYIFYQEEQISHSAMVNPIGLIIINY